MPDFGRLTVAIGAPQLSRFRVHRIMIQPGRGTVWLCDTLVFLPHQQVVQTDFVARLPNTYTTMIRMVRNLDPNPTWAESPIIEWAKGLHKRNVLQLELAKPLKRSAPVVVATLGDGSLYRISPPIEASNTGGGTLESIIPSDPVTRPVVAIAFKAHHLCLLDLLHICYSVRVNDGQITPSEDWPWFFGLIVLLSAVRQALSTQPALSLTPPPPMGAQPPLRSLWNDAYQLARLHELTFWKGSLLQRTESFAREVIREAAYEVLAPESHGLTRPDILSIIYRAEYLGRKEHNSRYVPQDLAWDRSWGSHPPTRSWLLRPFLWIFTEYNASCLKKLSSQIDARNMPHPYPVSSMLDNIQLVLKGLVGYEWTGTAICSSCGAGHNGNQPNSQCAGGQGPCQYQVWVSDWQIATCMAWNAAWNTALECGKDAVATHPPTPVPTQVTPQLHQRGVDEMSRDEQAYQKYKEERHGEALLAVRNGTRGCPPDTLGQLEGNAWNRAMENLRYHNGQLEQISEHKWRNILNKSLVPQRLVKDGRWVRSWKTNFEGVFQEAWKAAWASAWKATWNDAYSSTVSRGIYCGIETALEPLDADHRHLYDRHQELIARLRGQESYNRIKSQIGQGGVRDRLKCVQSLVKDLCDLTDRLQHTANTTHGDCVIVCALISEKTPTLDEIAKEPSNQRRLEDLSYDYFQMRTFIMENYVSKFSDGDQPKFCKSADRAWELLTDAKNGKPI